MATFITNTLSCWWSCYYFLNIISSLLLEISFPSYAHWAKLSNSKEPMSSGQGLVLNVELALKKPSLDRIQAQSWCYRRWWFMCGLTATSACVYGTKIMEASTHLRCAHTWGDAGPHSTEYLLAEVSSTLQLILSCWENCRKYLSPVSEAGVESGTPFVFRTSSAWASWELRYF